MDMNLSERQEAVEDRKSAVLRSLRLQSAGHNLATEQHIHR